MQSLCKGYDFCNILRFSTQSQYAKLGHVVRREQSSSIAIELNFAPPEINKR